MSGAARATGGRFRVDFGVLSPSVDFGVLSSSVGSGALFAPSRDNLAGWQGSARGKETAAAAR